SEMTTAVCANPKRKRCLSSTFLRWRRGWSTPTASPRRTLRPGCDGLEHSSSRWKRWSAPNTSGAVCWRKSAGRSWREQPEGATRSGEGIGKVFHGNISAECKVFHVEHCVLSNLCVPLCMYNRRNPERISRL